MTEYEVAQEVIAAIRARIKEGPPGWEDITRHGHAYHETVDSYDVDWILAILDEIEDAAA